MASGLPMAMVANQPAALLSQQHLAARGPAVAGQQLRAAQGGAVAAAAAAAAAAAEARRLAGKKRKAAEKAVAEKAVHLVPESPLFNSLMMQEHHLDDLIKRKRLELQAAANPLDCPVHKRLRVYIYNSHQPAAMTARRQQQQQQQRDGGSPEGAEPPQWTLTLWGRLDNPDPPAPASMLPGSAGSASSAGAGTSAAASAGGSSSTAAAGEPAAQPLDVHKLPPQPPAQQQQQSQPKYGFTSFFKRIEIQLEPEVYPDDKEPITWHKLQHRGAHKDRIEVKRVGSQPTRVTITFEQDFVPPAYKVDPRLAEVLGMAFGQHQMVLTRLYCYIINKTPQADPGQLLLDDKLEAIFGIKQLPTSALPVALGKLLQPLEPVTVTHTIETSGPSPGSVTCVDFDVFLPVKLQDKVAPALDSLMEDKQFDALEQKLTAQLTKLFEARRRRAMYLGFADDPVGFLNTIIASQARELRMARSGKELAVERRTDLFKDRWVDEAALRYLGRKSKQDALFPALNAAG